MALVVGYEKSAATFYVLGKNTGRTIRLFPCPLKCKPIRRQELKVKKLQINNNCYLNYGRDSLIWLGSRGDFMMIHTLTNATITTFAQHLHKYQSVVPFLSFILSETVSSFRFDSSFPVEGTDQTTWEGDS